MNLTSISSGEVMDDNYTTIAILKSDMETVEEICLREGWKKSAVIHNAVQYYYKAWSEEL